MKKFVLVVILFIVAYSKGFATHNRAGEITYQWVGSYPDHPYLYKIIVTTYTNTCNTQADRCELAVRFGDGTDSVIAPRVNGPSIQCPSTHDGFQITPCTKKNVYEVTHEYSGPSPNPLGYQITMDDMNRNAGTCNIPNSVNTSFSLSTYLIINPFLGPNNSPVLLNMPLDDACVGVCFYHNPGAYDPDGDSLSYSLTTCLAGGVAIPGWSMPPNMSYSSIDALRGDLVWCSPNQICNYNIAILIKEYRRLQGSPVRYYIGAVLRDMQITVASCMNNPPQINPINDTCIVAGTNLHFTVTAHDVENDVVSLAASGGPFQITPSATFTSTPTLTPVNGSFNWTPNCSEVQLLPYLVTFKATDSNVPNPLVDYKSVFIRVIAPAPTILSATPSGASIIVNWSPSICNSTIGNNPLTGYHVYRKNSCDPFVHDLCQTGLPSSTGYTLIGNTGPTTTTFTDNNSGNGLVNGINYSYIVVAYYSDGSQSYASGNVCAMLVRDVPVITNVSVISTGNSHTIWTHWIKPLSSLPNLDTIVNPPPYQYKVMRAARTSGSLLYHQISLNSDYIYNSYYQLPDTGFVSTGLHTADTSYVYRIDFYANSILKGSTNSASSVFLNTTPSGGQLTLTWQVNVPWANYRYDIFKETNIPGVFAFLDSTHSNSYTDTGLVNGQLYCYKIKTYGEYTDTLIHGPLVNTSQIQCGRPVDLIPPCQPNFMVENDCGIFENVVSWTNPNTYCSHDAVQINIYFAYTSNDPLQLIYSTTDMSITSFSHIYTFQGEPTVAGCYAVTAVDSAIIPNESPIVNKICVDNCPEYELPNVFTPNGDNINDMVTPLPGYRYVKDVDMKIYDRWGVLMFQTENKDILWDGKNKDTKGICPDGVYYYICIVNEIRVDGIRPRILKGFIQLFKEGASPAH